MYLTNLSWVHDNIQGNTVLQIYLLQTTQLHSLLQYKLLGLLSFGLYHFFVVVNNIKRNIMISSLLQNISYRYRDDIHRVVVYLVSTCSQTLSFSTRLHKIISCGIKQPVVKYDTSTTTTFAVWVNFRKIVLKNYNG